MHVLIKRARLFPRSKGQCHVALNAKIKTWMSFISLPINFKGWLLFLSKCFTYVCLYCVYISYFMMVPLVKNSVLFFLIFEAWKISFSLHSMHWHQTKRIRKLKMLSLNRFYEQTPKWFTALNTRIQGTNDKWVHNLHCLQV